MYLLVSGVYHLTKRPHDVSNSVECNTVPEV